MKHLQIARRPTPRPMRLHGFFLLFLLSGPAILLLRYLALPTPHRLRLLLFLSVINAIPLLVTAPLLWRRWQWNRRLPERLADYLARPLSPDDYAQLARAAGQHPEIKPWIADAYHDARITYREAEKLQDRINGYLDALPQQQLDALLRDRSTAKRQTR